METRILSGKKVARQMLAELRLEIESLRKRGFTPGLAAVLVGEDPASQLYVAHKTKTCLDLGMHSEQVQLPADTTTTGLLKEIGRLNRDDRIDGILVQLPLPPAVEQDKVLTAVHPAKDVDGFHPLNAGKLFLGNPALAPCTPMGIIEMLKREGVSLKASRAVVVGRSNIVGKPMAMLLLRAHATVTLCHSRTRNLVATCRGADILIAAVGRPALITGDYLSPGVVIVDVGTNRLEDRKQVVSLFGEDSSKMRSFDRRGSVVVGDVHPLHPLGLASAVTPVPGGVGPLTIAYLMKNTVTACRRRRADCRRSVLTR